MAEALQLDLQVLSHTQLVLDEEDPQSLHGSPPLAPLTPSWEGAGTNISMSLSPRFSANIARRWRRFLVRADDDRAIGRVEMKLAGDRRGPHPRSHRGVLKSLPGPALAGRAGRSSLPRR